MSSPSLSALLDSRRVLVCVGAGGVGKTTVAAAIALAGAERGRRVLCLTIDPSKRLVDALGLEALGPDPVVVETARFSQGTAELGGSLSVLVLDTKSTFDELVRRHAPSPDVAESILRNRVYGYVSTRLAGTQSYMAMEKVLTVKTDPRFDLVVLDTPPTSDALDFLNAPERLIETLDSPAMRWLVQALTSSGALSFNFLARGVAAMLRSIAKLTGQGLLQNLAEFISELNELFGGFKDRARQVSQAFRGEEFAYVIVATPASPALAEARFFARRLSELGMQGDVIVINRVHEPRSTRPTLDEVRQVLTERGLDAGLAAAVEQSDDEDAHQGQLDARELERFWRELSQDLAGEVPWSTELPVFGGDVHDFASLRKLVRGLVDAKSDA